MAEEKEEKTMKEKLKEASEALEPLTNTLVQARMSASPSGTVQLAGYQPMQKQPVVASDRKTKLKYNIRN